MSADHEGDAFFAEHAVSPEIWQARPYERWELGDADRTARRHFEDLNGHQQGHVTGMVNQAAGWVIRRDNQMLSGLKKILPELRPDWPVKIDRATTHWHGDGPPPTYGEYIEQMTKLGSNVTVDPDRDPNGPCPDWVLFKGNPTNHVRARDKREQDKPPKPGDRPGPVGRNRLRNPHLSFDHEGNVRVDDEGRSIGQNTELIHRHFEFIKYGFTPAGKMDNSTVEDHDFVVDRNGDYVIDANGEMKLRLWRPGPGRKGMKPEEVRAAHVEKWHDGEDEVGLHTHNWGRIKDPTDPIACRIDVHPMAEQKIIDDALVYFALEGCIKADAILTAGAAVFSVPSVTLWKCQELEAFVERYLAMEADGLGGKTVVIVCDADWETNPMVYTQAFLCASVLRRYDVPLVLVAAPPPTLNGKVTKGVDDWLRAGGRLAELEVVDSVPPDDFVAKVQAMSWRAGVKRTDRIAKQVDSARILAKYVGDDGKFAGSLEMLAAIWQGIGDPYKAATYLDEIGAITVDKGSLDTHRNHFSGREEFLENPRITISEELRFTRRRESLLAALFAWSPDAPYSEHFPADDVEMALSRLPEGI